MPWGARKGFNIGPLRLTISGRGLSWSLGTKGARAGRNADGRKHVTIRPLLGLSYRRTRR